MAKNFVHLHTHTEYSLLDGLSKIKKLFEHVKEHGMDTVAITDHGAMYGVIEFYKASKKYDMKPIIGMEGYLVKKDHTKKGERKKQKTYHILLLAKDYEGYQNLMKLTSIAHLEGYYYRPRFDKATLKKYSRGLICTSTCIAGEIPQTILDEDYDAAKKVAEWYLDVFSEDFYFEIQRHEYDKYLENAPDHEVRAELIRQSESEKLVNEGVIKLSRELGIPIVATNDAHYVKKEDATAQDALLCVATGKNISDTKRLRFIDTPTFYVRPPDEMNDLFGDLPDAISNTVEVAKKCELDITLGQFFFPQVDLPSGKTAEEILREKANRGLRDRYEEITPALQERLDYELDVINNKGYPAYFLIYEDLAAWASEKNIPITTRGSAAGSLVSYSLKITQVDPIKFNLPFERFLNPFRPSAPDIDLDVADDKREDIINYLIEKYGDSKVAQICTFGRMLARGAVRDVARVMGYPYATGDKISKMIPPGAQGFPMTVERALSESVDLADLYKNDNDAKRIIDLAREVEGNARHISVHAAGVVVAPSELTDFTPVQLQDDRKITQYEMHACEDVGLVKLDVLGIRNLSILRGAIERVRETRGETVDISNIPLDDTKTFEMLARGETMGTFQLSGSGMTRFLKDLEPERIDDLMAMVALYRPGPMANIPHYIARKKGEEDVAYYHPKMEKYLDKSFGILVYQDDLLFTALELAGYDWEEVDKFRKAVGKKIPEEMAKQHKIFVAGCIKHSGMSKAEAEGLWELFEPFQGYGFNKAHAAAYGLVAYQTAYMKANYPVEYMSSLLTAESGNTDKLTAAVNECKRMGIKVLQPDINRSGVGFNIVEDAESLDGRAVAFGLSAIKNVGDAAIEAILEARSDGDFISFPDFISRVDQRRVNKKVLESLIKVGAMSDFGTRAGLLDSIDEVRIKVGKPTGAAKGQQGLFGDEEMEEGNKEEKIKIDSDLPEAEEEIIQSWERELMGFSLSARPMIELLAPFVSHTTHKIFEIEEVSGPGESAVKVAGVVSDVRVVTTKRTGQEMAFVKVRDDTGTVSLVVFPKIYKDTRLQWIDNNPILIAGKLDKREEELSILVDEVITETALTETKTTKEGQFFINIPRTASVDDLKALKQILLENQGTQPVSLIFEGKNNKRVDLSIKVEWSSRLTRMVSDILEG